MVLCPDDSSPAHEAPEWLRITRIWQIPGYLESSAFQGEARKTAHHSRIPDVLRLANEGKTQSAIAKALGLSQPTVSRILVPARAAGLLPGREAHRERVKPHKNDDGALLTLIRDPVFMSTLGNMAKRFEATFCSRFAMDREDLTQKAFEIILHAPPGSSRAWYLQRIEWAFGEILKLDHQVPTAPLNSDL